MLEGCDAGAVAGFGSQLWCLLLGSALARHVYPAPSTVRAANSSAQLQTQLPGALLTVGGAGGGGGAAAASLRILGYASSAPLLRSNIVVCSAVLHVIGGVLLVRGGVHGGREEAWEGRPARAEQGRWWVGACRAACLTTPPPDCLPLLPSLSCTSAYLQPSSPLSTVIPYSVAVEGLEPLAATGGAPAAARAPAAEAAPSAAAGAAPAAEAPAVEAVRAALAAERQQDAASLKSESLAAAAAAPAVEAAGEAGTALPANATLNTTTAAAFTPADCPANPLIALG